jgi:hypothetical protein
MPLRDAPLLLLLAVSSMREFAILPDEAHSIVAQSGEALNRLLGKNIEAEESKMDPESVAEMVIGLFLRVVRRAQSQIRQELLGPQN